MFKKSLAALAVLGTAAGFASAANVNMYGIVDTGMVYNNVKGYTNAESIALGKKVKSHSFTLDSGVSSASRFGLKGSEDLGNGMTVGFTLENGFNADDGKLNNDSRLFGREAALHVNTEFGTVAFGRMGGLASSAGSYDTVWSIADSLGGMDGFVGGLAISDRYDNMITYRSPKISGVQATVQYSFNEDSSDADREGSSQVNRYAAAAVTGDFGALQSVLAYEFQNYESFGETTIGEAELPVPVPVKDGHTVYFGGNYDCGFAKTFAMVQYFKNVKLSSITASGAFDSDFVAALDYAAHGATGFGLHLGTVVPVAGGDLTVAAYYTDGKIKPHEVFEEEDVKFKSFAFGGKYEYFVSKRTSLYTGAGYQQVKVEDESKAAQAYQAYAGLTHRF